MNLQKVRVRSSFTEMAMVFHKEIYFLHMEKDLHKLQNTLFITREKTG